MAKKPTHQTTYYMRLVDFQENAFKTTKAICESIARSDDPCDLRPKARVVKVKILEYYSTIYAIPELVADDPPRVRGEKEHTDVGSDHD